MKGTKEIVSRSIKTKSVDVVEVRRKSKSSKSIDAQNSSAAPLIKEITTLHSEIGNYMKIGLEKAFRIGELLFELKSKLKHGNFSFWVSENIPFSQRTAQRYMKLFLYKEKLINDNVSSLTKAYNAVCNRPFSEDVIDANDSLDINGTWTIDSSNVDEITLPKKQARGMMQKVVLSQSSLNDLRTAGVFKNAQGIYTKLVIKVPGLKYSSDPERIQYFGEFLIEAVNLLKIGGKLIFHKSTK